jgi:hypothetical protein
VNRVKLDFNIARLFNSSGNSAIINLRNCSTEGKLLENGTDLLFLEFDFLLVSLADTMSP